MPADPLEAGEWPATSSATVSIALNLVPFAGVAFMWFLGVLRDRLGAKEDKFFATVFLGSGLMFLGMIFIYPAAGGGLILTYSAVPRALRDGATFAFARTFTYEVMHVYAFKMAAVFMVTTSTLKGDGALDRIRLRRSDTPADWQQLSGLGSVCLSLLGIPGEP
jgi:hypothetical protein